MRGWGLVSIVLCVAGCSGDDDRTLTVLAASSLADAFAELEADFEAAHPGVDVVVSVGGTQALATWVRHGLEADVLASADARHAEALAGEQLLEPPRPFARNALVLVVSDELGAASLEALPVVERLVVGAPEVPVGRYTAALLGAAEGRYGATWRQQVEARVVSREPSARQVAAKVALGEADAAFVYATDVAVLDGATVVTLPTWVPPAAYLHAPLAEPLEPELAAAWIRHVESPAGQAVLAAHGFLAP